MRLQFGVLAIVVIAGLVLTTPAGAEAKCREGKTMSGACVNPELSRMMRKQTFLATQPKLSYTAPPVMPGDDSVERPLTSNYETLNLVTLQASRGRFAAP